MKTLSDLERARRDLSSRDTVKCVLRCGERSYESEKRGVAPMLDFLEQGIDLHGFSAADRVVGRATAFLFVLAGITSVFGEVVSEGAYELLAKHGIPCEAQKVVPYIINRKGDGQCPMERAVLGIEDPEEAYRAVLQTKQALSNQ